MTDSERIKELLKYLNVSANKLSKELKLATPQVFYDIKAGRCGISKELARKINEKYINVNPVWLLTGAGRMIDDLAFSPDKSEPIDMIDGAKHDSPEPAEVPLVDIGGVGNIPQTDRFSHHSGEIMLAFPDSQRGDLAIRHYGDSMSPIIPAGAILLIRKVEQWKEYLGYGNDFVIILSDGRRLTKHIVGRTMQGAFLARSYKEGIEDESIPISMVQEVWKVISVLSLQGW